MGHWALAIWERWLPTTSLLQLMAGALKVVCAKRNGHSWCHAVGPASGTLRTAARIGWTIHDAFTFISDLGVEVHLGRDSPAMVKQL
eukprot:6781994-Karenia_brevis.AAC.1